jgi:hypothetical protein
MKGLLIVFVLALLGNYLVERFVIKDPNDEADTGFIEARPGFGLDDAARAGGLALVIVFGGKLARRFLGGK